MTGIIGLFALSGIVSLISAFVKKADSEEYIRTVIPVTVEYKSVWSERTGTGNRGYHYSTTRYYASGLYTYEGQTYTADRVSVDIFTSEGGTGIVYIHADNPAHWEIPYTNNNLISAVSGSVIKFLISFIVLVLFLAARKKTAASTVFSDSSTARFMNGTTYRNFNTTTTTYTDYQSSTDFYIGYQDENGNDTNHSGS